MTTLPDCSQASLLDLVIKTAPDAIITIDVDAQILTFSPAAEAMFGYREADLVGRNVACLMPEPHRSNHQGYMTRYLETGEKRIIGIGREVRAQRKSGEIFVAELAIGELLAGARPVFTGFIRDVTDRIEAVRKANHLQHTLDQMNRVQLLGEMSTALAHEINQPLAAITNFSRAARRFLESDAPDLVKAKAHLDRVAEQAVRAGEIIKRMRKMVDRGQADLRPDDLNSIVTEAISTAWGGGDPHAELIALELAEELLPVHADRIQIQQVVINLIQNALEAVQGQEHRDIHVSTDHAKAGGQITLGARRVADREVQLTVSDTGPGIPAGLLQTIFDPLVTTKHSGIGVGLAICRTIVHSHGGRIWAENNHNGGASVHFTLPWADRQ